MQSDGVDLLIINLKDKTLHVKDAKIEINTAWSSLCKVFNRSEIKPAQLGFIIGALASHHNFTSK